MARQKPAHKILEAEALAYDAIAASAAGAGKHKDQITALHQAGKLRAQARRLAEVDRAERLKDPIARLRAMAKIAENEGSWVASASMETQAARLQIERETTEAQARAAGLEDLALEDYIAIIVGHIATLPLEQVEQVYAACQDAMGIKQAQPVDLADELLAGGPAGDA